MTKCPHGEKGKEEYVGTVTQCEATTDRPEEGRLLPDHGRPWELTVERGAMHEGPSCFSAFPHLR